MPTGWWPETPGSTSENRRPRQAPRVHRRPAPSGERTGHLHVPGPGPRSLPAYPRDRVEPWRPMTPPVQGGRRQQPSTMVPSAHAQLLLPRFGCLGRRPGHRPHRCSVPSTSRRWRTCGGFGRIARRWRSIVSACQCTDLLASNVRLEQLSCRNSTPNRPLAHTVDRQAGGRQSPRSHRSPGGTVASSATCRRRRGVRAQTPTGTVAPRVTVSDPGAIGTPGRLGIR